LYDGEGRVPRVVVAVSARDPPPPAIDVAGEKASGAPRPHAVELISSAAITGTQTAKSGRDVRDCLGWPPVQNAEATNR